ncbi:MAG: phospholipase D family protein [Candidatus Micrarchaeota archaeon]
MSRGMIFGAGLALGLIIGFAFSVFAVPPEAEAVFSPEDGREIIDFIDSARETLEIEVYTMSSRDVVDALGRARARGVDVRIILERNVLGGENAEIYRELSAKGFAVRYASKAFKLTHSKFIIVDGNEVLVGSHNLSNSALFSNREASVIVRDAAIVGEFSEIFEGDWELAN